MTVVPIGDETPIAEYVSAAAQTDFVFTFTIYSTSDIEVYLNNGLKVEVTDYLVRKSNGDPILPEDIDFGLLGGKVVFNSGLALDDLVTLFRNIPIERISVYTNAGDFRAETLNVEQNLELAIMQQLRRDIDRSVSKDPSDSLTGTTILPLDRANQFLAFDNDGGLIASPGSIGGSPLPVSVYIEGFLPSANAAAALTYLGISAYMQTLLDDADAATARATLDAQEDIIFAEGDIIVGDGSGDPSILLIGATDLVLTSDGTTPSYQVVPFSKDHMSGLIVSNAGDADHDLTIAIGECRDQNNTKNMNLLATITKQIDAVYAEGNDLGGFPSGLNGGVVQANTTYHYFLIRKSEVVLRSMIGVFSHTSPFVNSTICGMLIDPSVLKLNTLRYSVNPVASAKSKVGFFVESKPASKVPSDLRMRK